MSFSVYAASAPIFVRALNNAAAIIDKALAAGLDETAILEARLAPDMHPFPRQIQMASDAAKGAVARLAGVEVPSMPDTEATLAELKARIAKTIAFIESVDASAFAGAEDREIVLKFPNMELKFTGAEFLTGFALPNFFFHATTAYALLRAAGAPIGKMDFLGGR
ncbi:MAG TPA: DUF1993 domain-containing protein [Caulobacter sp.]|nr:DUF1993 domain-containing protein [Caulobacter sp.]